MQRHLTPSRFPATERLQIGELARRTGCNIDTIRYYEKIGVLASPMRTEGGFRVYTAGDARRLSFIRRARELGFPLEEVRAMLSLSDERAHPCAEVQQIAIGHLAEVFQDRRPPGDGGGAGDSDRKMRAGLVSRVSPGGDPIRCRTDRWSHQPAVTDRRQGAPPRTLVAAFQIGTKAPVAVAISPAYTNSPGGPPQQSLLFSFDLLALWRDQIPLAPKVVDVLPHGRTRLLIPCEVV